MNRTRNKIERQREVAKFRLRGVTDQCTIAAHFGVHQSTICRDFAELDQHYQVIAAQDIAAAKGVDLARLDALIEALWPEAMKGNAKTWHIDRVLKCLERRAALLGLDAPAKREDTMHVMISRFVTKAAEEAGLDPSIVVAQAERLLAEAQGR